MVSGGGAKARVGILRGLSRRDWIRGGPDEACLVRAECRLRFINLS